MSSDRRVLRRSAPPTNGQPLNKDDNTILPKADWIPPIKLTTFPPIVTSSYANLTDTAPVPSSPTPSEVTLNSPESFKVHSGVSVGSEDGCWDGIDDGAADGIDDGTDDGTDDGMDDGVSDGVEVGVEVGFADGFPVGLADGFPEGVFVKSVLSPTPSFSSVPPSWRSDNTRVLIGCIFPANAYDDGVLPNNWRSRKIHIILVRCLMEAIMVIVCSMSFILWMEDTKLCVTTKGETLKYSAFYITVQQNRL